MKKRRKKVSVITVTYKEDKELMAGLSALLKSNAKAKVSLDVIVVDNNRQARLRLPIKQKFPQVRYINTGKNIGFGAANNVGAAQAVGEYLFFLNPDTEIQSGAVYQLAKFLDQQPKAAVVAPTLYDMKGKVYPDQGTNELTPLTAIAAHSIVHRIWPTNPIANNFWQRFRDSQKPHQLQVIPGTAFMIRKSVFEKANGFDQQFFIYFEEYDLCRRVRQLGWQIWIIPAAKVKHIWHAATQSSNYNLIYAQSRRKYFTKYYGPVIGGLVDFCLRFGKKEILLLLVVVVAFTLLSLTGVLQ